MLSTRYKVVAVAAGVAIGVALYLGSGGRQPVRFVTAPVTRGPIVRAVSATGTLNPVVTVQVGSYVSGPIQALYADFNSPVKQGQLIAKIDPRPFEVKAAQARAALANARAELLKDQADAKYKKLSYERNLALLKAGAVSRDALDAAENAYHQAVAQVALAKAQIDQQRASLQEAEVNLDYTNIVSPVDGTVVSRNVDVGQTVAASFQTPTLFLIARDLTQMQVDSNVSESDIGDVRIGQPASFAVDAFPERAFEGAVGQVRQAPITVQNVVTYDVVVSVANPELLLKPGMTANLTIVTAKRDDVVRIPLQAIRFSPGGIAAGKDHAAESQARPGGSAGIARNSRVWLRDGNHGLKPARVTTGLDDGNNVEMLAGELHPGDEVVVDEIREPVASRSSSSPPRFPR